MGTEIVGYDEIVGAITRNMGVKLQHRRTRRGVAYRAIMRGPKGPIVISHEEQHPTEVGGALGRKIKKGLKKVAKSKVLGKVIKIASAVASVVPGGQALALGGAALTAINAAKKAAKGVKGAIKLGKGAARLVKAASGKGGKKGGRKALPAASGPAAAGGRIVTASNGRSYQVVAL